MVYRGQCCQRRGLCTLATDITHDEAPIAGGDCEHVEKVAADDQTTGRRPVTACDLNAGDAGRRWRQQAPLEGVGEFTQLLLRPLHRGQIPDVCRKKHVIGEHHTGHGELDGNSAPLACKAFTSTRFPRMGPSPVAR